MPEDERQSEFPESRPLSVHRYAMNPFLIFIGLLLFIMVFPLQLGLFGVPAKSATYVVAGALVVLLIIIGYGATEKIEVYAEGLGFRTCLGKEFIRWEDVGRITVTYSLGETLLSFPVVRREYDIYVGTARELKLIDLSTDITEAALLLRELKRRAKSAEVRCRKKMDFLFLHYDPDAYWRNL